MNEKKLIRNQMKEALAGISKPQYEDDSLSIARRLYREPEWLSAEVVGITISKPPEVDTYQIIRKCWELGKRVVVPKCHPQGKTLTFHTLTKFSQLETVFFGLWEPVEQDTIEVDSENIDLLLVPGLAFTREGCRIGFGGGYYDRFLKSYHGKTISLAFSMQLLPQIPVEEHDIPVLKVITDQEVIQTK